MTTASGTMIPHANTQIRTMANFTCVFVEKRRDFTGWRMAMYLSTLRAMMVSTLALIQTPESSDKISLETMDIYSFVLELGHAQLQDEGSRLLSPENGWSSLPGLLVRQKPYRSSPRDEHM